MRKLSTVQNGGFPNVFSFHIIHYTLFSSLKNICNKKDFHVARQTCWWKRPFHVGCQEKSGPGKIHEVILVHQKMLEFVVRNRTHFYPRSKTSKRLNGLILALITACKICHSADGETFVTGLLRQPLSMSNGSWNNGFLYFNSWGI